MENALLSLLPGKKIKTGEESIILGLSNIDNDAHENGKRPVPPSIICKLMVYHLKENLSLLKILVGKF